MQNTSNSQCYISHLFCILTCRYFLSSVPRTGRVWHKAFFGGSGCRAVASTDPAFLKMPQDRSAFPYRRHVMNLTPPRRVRAWGNGPLRLENAGQSQPRPTVSRARTHPTRSVYRPTQPSEMYPSRATFKECAYTCVSTRVTVSISYDDNDYTTVTSTHASPLVSVQTAVRPIYTSTPSRHMNSSSTIHFNTCVCWIEIRFRTSNQHR